MQPLTQSTGETPSGPLTLRVFAPDSSTECEGDLYLDDGRSFDFLKGHFLREHFSCHVAADGRLVISLSKQEGDFKPWWTSVRIEAIGWTPVAEQPTADWQSHPKGPIPVEKTAFGWAITVPRVSGSLDIVIR